VLKKRWFLCS